MSTEETKPGLPPSGQAEPTVYRSSPRPQFAGPAAIPFATVTRHIWGDAEAGEVFDWIYGSTDKIHALVFGLAPAVRSDIRQSSARCLERTRC